MYNIVKRCFWLITAIFTIIFGVIDFISVIIIFFLISAIGDITLNAIFSCIALLVLFIDIIVIVLGALSCKKPKLMPTGKYLWNKGCMIAILVIYILSLIGGCILVAIGYTIYIIDLVLAIICLAFAITSLAIQDEITIDYKGKTADSNNNNKSKEFGEKMDELKKLKELHVITEEQYNEASQKIFDDYKDNL